MWQGMTCDERKRLTARTFFHETRFNYAAGSPRPPLNRSKTKNYQDIYIFRNQESIVPVFCAF